MLGKKLSIFNRLNLFFFSELTRLCDTFTVFKDTLMSTQKQLLLTTEKAYTV